MLHHRDELVFVSVVLLLFSLTQCLYAQDTGTFGQSTQEGFRIEWVGTFSSTKDLGKKTGVAGGLLNYLFGKNNRRLLRPINLMVSNSTWWVLDQGGRFVSRIDKKRGKFNILKFKHYAALPSLVGICAGSDNTIYFTDSQLNQVFVMNNSGKSMTTLGHDLDLSRPTGIAYSNIRKNIWLAETGAHRLVVLNKNGGVVKYVGRRGSAPGEFNFPTFLWIDDQGTVFVIDSMNFRVQIFSPDGDFLSEFGQAGDASGYFAHPKGLATDSYGHIYVADALFNTVQIFDRQGTFLSNFGSQGRKPGEFWLPTGIFIAKNNMIYVADSYNARIQIFELLRTDD